MDHDVLVAGETLIDFVPDRAGPLEFVDGFRRRPGGAPANVAVGLSKLGRPPLFWTRLARDSFGRYLDRTLADHGIPDRFVTADPDAKTTLAFVTHDSAGDREFTFYREGTADTRMEPGTVPDPVLAELEWVHVGGVTLASGRSREATLDLLERAASMDCTVSFDPNLRSALWKTDETLRRVCHGALAHVDVLKATVTELALLGFDGESPHERAHEVLDYGHDTALGDGPHTVFLTRGSEGALAVGSDRSPCSGDVVHEGYDVSVVDTTGAGDAFVAGAISSLLERESLDRVLAFANAVAALATTEPGAMSAFEELDAVHSLIASTGGA